ncbi:MAG TPA: hypothetical protein H9932_08540 [Candidatus Brachybacterium intestinipullorum]|uniref:Uncharacterized protein n=1 Tax=Candidatus Brachybacterium intestinipullorum TaxID=2838512 RepID=A0A9D2PYK0_9MICO|nr:hypothetical protein [Candidatus Brachybacterium intestinipullorum]
MQRLLAVLLVLVGLIGLALGRLGDTVWAPDTETTAAVTLEDPGPAVVIDPGVLYVGGEEGQVTIEGASDVSVITASNGDIDAYLDGVHHTRITGASDWSTLSTEDVDPDGEAELSDPTSSDLWRSVDTSESPYTLDVHEFWAGENGENEQVYRALLIVTDGTEPGAESVSITWPVDAENEWVPYAYAGGAAVAVIGLVLLVVSLGRRRDEDEEELAPVEDEDLASGPVDAGSAGEAEDEDSVADEDPLDAPGAREVGEQHVWAFGAATSGSAAEDPSEDPSEDDAEDRPASEEDQQR